MNVIHPPLSVLLLLLSTPALTISLFIYPAGSLTTGKDSHSHTVTNTWSITHTHTHKDIVLVVHTHVEMIVVCECVRRVENEALWETEFTHLDICLSIRLLQPIRAQRVSVFVCAHACV